MTQSKATLAGIEDAVGFTLVADKKALAQALKTGQASPDEGLINALGIEKASALFGVKHGTKAWSAACAEYNAAFIKVIAKAVQS